MLLLHGNNNDNNNKNNIQSPLSNVNNSSQDPIQHTIWHCLNNYAYEDAIFLAERLNASSDASVEVELVSSRLHLLATAYYRSNRKLQCYDLLKNHYKSPSNLNYKCRFLLATVSIDINKLSESEQYLLYGRGNGVLTLDHIEKTYNEISCFALKLYGKICIQTDRLASARDAFARALKINPFLFEAFELLCNHNEDFKIDTTSVFQTSHMSEKELNANCHGICDSTGSNEFMQRKYEPSNVLIPTNRNTRNNNNNNRCHRNLFTSTPNNNNNFFGSPPNTSSLMVATTSSNTNFTPNNNDGNSSSASLISPIIIMDEPRPKKPCLRTVSSPQQQIWQNNQSFVRRSSRLTTATTVSSPQQTSASLKENSSSKESKWGHHQQQRPSTSSTTSPSVGNNNKNKIILKPNNSQSQDNNDQIPNIQFKSTNKAIESMLGIMREIGRSYYHLTRYDCKETIEILTNLKSHQQNTPYILNLIARAFFEISDYDTAVSYYNKLRMISPNDLTGLDYMSTALWHLQKESDLSILSQELLSEPLNRSNPITWISLGNTFSLQKEHENAIKFFKRALQVDPKATYAYTLLGHEYVTTEELEKALRCYRSASRIDSKHYNCWYGMGMIFYKQERFSQAEVYYKKAISINSHNSVLLCHLGVVQSALNRTEKSLQTFNEALKLNPTDPLCKFHRASVLFAINRLDEALDELDQLKRIVPKESLVHFLIAKIYSKKGDTHKALLHFSWATDLDPKGANNHIKESIEPVLATATATTSQIEHSSNDI